MGSGQRCEAQKDRIPTSDVLAIVRYPGGGEMEMKGDEEAREEEEGRGD